ncbi:MAG TPA: hypothetical protein VK928_07365 [Longimicrobiales bacterium]|nr:hypothetical protein [Longimicrobiales bacterium]
MIKRKSGSDDLAHRVDELQVRALQCTIPGESAALFNRAGDLLLAESEVEAALELYGRAVDSFIEADRFEAGIALCKKIIRTSPNVVRARCTLTWLVIGGGYTVEAEARVAEYVSFAERSGREHIARRQLHMMSRVAREHSLRLALGDYLLLLGDAFAADEVFGEVFSERNGARSTDVDPAQTWESARRESLMGPEAMAGVR